MNENEVSKLLEIGVALSAERDYNHLLDLILNKAMELANCDAGTLYLADGDVLRFKIMRNNTLNTYEGGDGREVSLPAVFIQKQNVCALSFILNQVLRFRDVYQCEEYDFSGPAVYDKMTGYHTESMLVMPMNTRDGECIGVIQLINALDDGGNVVGFSEEMEYIIRSIASQAAVAIENMNYVHEIRGQILSFAQVFTVVAGERTPYNAAHVRNMVRYGEKFINYINTVQRKKDGTARLSQKQMEGILLSIWLHDVGKLGVPLEIMNKEDRLGGRFSELSRRLDVIKLQNKIAVLDGTMDQEEAQRRDEDVELTRELLAAANVIPVMPEKMAQAVREVGERLFQDVDGTWKPWLTDLELEELTIRKGTLTQKERQIMESHVVLTEKILSQIHFTKEYEDVPVWASQHHEFLNGEGYPAGLKGDDICYEVRIITILDIFAALTASDRPYRVGMPVSEALVVLMRMAEKEKKLDKELTELFVESRCWERQA